MGFSRQEDWSELPFSSPGDYPDPGMEPVSPAGRFFTNEPPGKPKSTVVRCRIKKNLRGKKSVSFCNSASGGRGVCVCVCVCVCVSPREFESRVLKRDLYTHVHIAGNTGSIPGPGKSHILWSN